MFDTILGGVIAVVVFAVILVTAVLLLLAQDIWPLHRSRHAPTLDAAVKGDGSPARQSGRAVTATLALVAMLCSCSAVYSTDPIGTEPAGLEAQRTEWEGIWTVTDGAAIVQLAAEGNDEVVVHWLRKEGTRVEYDAVDVTVKRYGNIYIANATDLDDPERYLWGVIEKESDVIKIWVPDAKRFEALLKQGKLKGETDWDGNVYLSGLSQRQIEVVLAEFGWRGAPTDGFLFHRSPIVVTKAAGPGDRTFSR